MTGLSVMSRMYVNPATILPTSADIVTEGVERAAVSTSTRDIIKRTDWSIDAKAIFIDDP